MASSAMYGGGELGEAVFGWGGAGAGKSGRGEENPTGARARRWQAAATKVQSIARMSLAGQAWLGVGLGLGPGLGLSLTSKHVARRAGRLPLNLPPLTLTLTLIRTRT